ncbi:MAG: glycosyltransferase family 2 protein [Chloroflexota bacterium]
MSSDDRSSSSEAVTLGTNPNVAVILVTYDGLKYLDKLYTALCRLQYPRERYFLLVVDNGPGHEAQQWFATRAPAVRVIVPDNNTGYAGGNAIGMEEALVAGVDYVAIVTQDTEIDPLWLRALVDVAQRYPNAGAIQPKILRRAANGQAVIHTWGTQLHFLGVGYVGGDGLPDRALETRPIASASGAGVLYRANALREVGLFDTKFFMYHEDVDLSWRLRLAGWEVLLAPDAVMYHDYEFAPGAAKFYYLERNRLINILTHYRLRTLVLIAPAFFLFEALTLLYALSAGWFWKRLTVYGFFFKPANWKYLREKRRQVQSIRQVPDRAVALHLTGRIDFGQLDNWILRRIVNPAFNAYWNCIQKILAW